MSLSLVEMQAASAAGTRDTARARSRLTLGATPAQYARPVRRAGARPENLSSVDALSTGSTSSVRSSG